MPHVIVKVATGTTREQRERLAEAVTENVIECFGKERDEISVAIEEFPKERWKEDVYEPEIKAHPETLYKKPGYSL